MNALEKMQLIELKRYELQVLLRQATGVDVDVNVHVYFIYQDTRELACCAARAGWTVDRMQTIRFVRSPNRPGPGETVVFVPRDVASQACAGSSPCNPLADPIHPLHELDAFIALSRLSAAMPCEEEE